MGRNLRSVHKLKTRQPLKELHIITQNKGDKKTIETFQDLLNQLIKILIFAVIFTGFIVVLIFLMKFIDESGTIKTITVPGKASFYLDLGRTGGPARKEVLARFSSSWVPIYRGAMNGIRERVVISKISNL